MRLLRASVAVLVVGLTLAQQALARPEKAWRVREEQTQDTTVNVRSRDGTVARVNSNSVTTTMSYREEVTSVSSATTVHQRTYETLHLVHGTTRRDHSGLVLRISRDATGAATEVTAVGDAEPGWRGVVADFTDAPRAWHHLVQLRPREGARPLAQVAIDLLGIGRDVVPDSATAKLERGEGEAKLTLTCKLTDALSFKSRLTYTEAVDYMATAVVRETSPGLRYTFDSCYLGKGNSIEGGLLVSFVVKRRSAGSVESE